MFSSVAHVLHWFKGSHGTQLNVPSSPSPSGQAATHWPAWLRYLNVPVVSQESHVDATTVHVLQLIAALHGAHTSLGRSGLSPLGHADKHVPLVLKNLFGEVGSQSSHTFELAVHVKQLDLHASHTEFV